MLRNLSKFTYMIRLGIRYIKLFKSVHVHPFMTPKAKSQNLSKLRQSYSNAVLHRLNVEVVLHGEIPKQDGILYAINHRSLLDIIVMEHIFSNHHKNGIWIAKEELFNAFYGDFFRYSGCVSVDLENKKGLLKFFKEIKHKLSIINDLNVYIFPEGERYKGKGITKFQAGATKIAQANGLDIVPIYIHDELEKVFAHSPYKQTRIVHVHVGGIVSSHNLEDEYTLFQRSITKEQK